MGREHALFTVSISVQRRVLKHHSFKVISDFEFINHESQAQLKKNQYSVILDFDIVLW